MPLILLYACNFGESRSFAKNGFTHVTLANHGHSRKMRRLNACEHFWIYGDMISDIASLLAPLEDAIRLHLIPALTGFDACPPPHSKGFACSSLSPW